MTSLARVHGPTERKPGDYLSTHHEHYRKVVSPNPPSHLGKAKEYLWNPSCELPSPNWTLLLYTQMLVGLEPSSGPHDRDLTAHAALEHEEGRPEDTRDLSRAVSKSSPCSLGLPYHWKKAVKELRGSGLYRFIPE